MAEVMYCGKYEGPVNAGEERLQQFLEANLPEGYFILPGIEIANLNPRNNQVQYLEYDCLVVTPHAIYNIENKDYSGRLEGDDDYWYHRDKEMRNPHKTLRFKTGVLAGKLKEKTQDWAKAWIQSIVTLSHPHQALQYLFGSHVKATFMLNDNLIKYITDPYSVGKVQNDIIKIYKGIADEICGTASRKNPNKKREVEGYEIVEVLDQEKNYTEYLAKPKGVSSAVRKRIREYALDLPNLNSEQREKRNLQIKNAYNALNRIKSNPFILNVQFKIDEENHRFYEITDFLDENTLRAEMVRKTFTFEDKLRIISNLISALKAAHEANVFHRDLNPENVYLTGGYACLGNFGKSYFSDHQEEGFTVMATITEQTATAYHALELLQKEASPSTDIYSLGVLAYELIVGKKPFASPFELNLLGGKLSEDKLPTKVNPALPKWLDEFCSHSIRTSPEDRWKNMSEMELFLMKSTEQEGQKDSRKTPSVSPFNFEVGSRVADYTIYGHIGTGGYSQVYKVKHNLRSNSVYALKVFNESVNASTVIDEYDALKELNHPNIVQFRWNGSLANGQFYTLMEYLEGDSLKDYAKGEKRLPIPRIYQVAKDILSALVTMQEKDPAIFHRDIKPQNIVWDKGTRFVLIDFNVASFVDGNKEHVGTHPYLAPDLIADNTKVNWDKSADPFALGITLYELCCKAYPWAGSLRMPLVDVAPTNPRDHNPRLSQALSEFLLKALGTRLGNRFSNAHEMYQALLQIGEDNLIEPEKPVDIVGEARPETSLDFVAYVNSLFSQSRHGNAGTRSGSKNSVLDNLTYTPTKLDERLIPDILGGRYRLVIITGNAGDGKTALIRKIEEKAKNRTDLPHRNGATFIIDGVSYQSNYDGSQDEEERANDLVLAEFFKPFEGLSDYSKAKDGRIIAINEGRLVEFLKTSGKLTTLGNSIEEYFYQEGKIELSSGLLIVNLNLRSVVADEDKKGSLFRRQLQKLTNKELWSKCDNCAAAEKCFIKYNVETINDSAAGEEIITRLEWLLRIVTLKREMHITMRDLRSLISFLLTRDYHCSEIGDLYNSTSENKLTWWNLFYFNITNSNFADSGNQDRLVKLLRETDIADVAIPRLDRDLFFGIHKAEHYLEFGERQFNLIEEFNGEKIWVPAHENTDDLKLKTLELHKTFIRHQYYEGKITFEQRLPYRSVALFIEILRSIGSNQEKVFRKTILSISKAVSFNEGCDKKNIYSEYLVLSSSHIEDPIGKTYRLFPLDHFELVINKVEHLVNYLEYEPDSLLFRSKTERAINLTISLDLFEMLDFISKGYSPSLNDLRGRFVELHIFKNLLENKDYKEVVVTRDNREFFIVKMNVKNKIEVVPFSLIETFHEAQ